ncbi:hypothetical protein LXA43DRAFT_905538 [Ganoderma leucocontextum]|nr:hypothetical protein LXA43DRAFT_905538 [Ganoderma leucocontextum]
MYLFGQSGHRPNDPEIVFIQEMAPKRCWPFPGTSGTLGIDLDHNVYPINVTIGHHFTHTPSGSAPRDIFVWGITDSPATPQNVTTFLVEHQSRSFPRHLIEHLSSGVPILLGELRYDTQRSEPLQSMTLEETRGIVCNKVVIEVADNWGSEEYTCLYHVRIQGFR